MFVPTGIPLDVNARHDCFEGYLYVQTSEFAATETHPPAEIK